MYHLPRVTFTQRHARTVASEHAKVAMSPNRLPCHPRGILGACISPGRRLSLTPGSNVGSATSDPEWRRCSTHLRRSHIQAMPSAGGWQENFFTFLLRVWINGLARPPRAFNANAANLSGGPWTFKRAGRDISQMVEQSRFGPDPLIADKGAVGDVVSPNLGMVGGVQSSHSCCFL